MKLTRRTFLKLAGATGATAAVATQMGGEEGALTALEPRTALAAEREEKWVPSVCFQCPAGCGILVRVVDGRAVKIEGNPRHPINEGGLCPKGQAGLQILYDPDRIKGPLKRVGARGEGKWQRISWEEAIASVAAKLKEIRDRGEPHTVAFMSGRNQGQIGDLIGRFLAAYGSPNDVGHSSICADGSPQAHYLTQGFKAYTGYDWDNTNYLLCFGGGFIEAWRPTVRLLRAYGHMRRGRPLRAKIVQVDTRLSVTAAKADEWIPINPGTDGALALGIAHVIVKEDLYDREFVEKRTFGFDDWVDDKGQKHIGFKRLVLEDYPPEKAAQITGVPAATIVRIAREFAAARPAAIAAGERGASMQTNGVYNRMAIHALNALVGSIDRPGGITMQAGPPFAGYPSVVRDEIAEAGVKKPRIDYAGTKRYPLAAKVYQGIPESILGEGPYPVNAVLLNCTNPLFSTPDVERFPRAFAKVPLIVDFTPFMSETAAYADYILPDHSYLERWQDVAIYPSVGYPVVGLRQPAVKPLYDTMNTGDALIKIAQAIGGSVAASFPWDSFEEVMKLRAKGLWAAKRGTIVTDTFDEFWAKFQEDGVWAAPPYRFEQWDRVLPTPSKKFEFYSQNLKKTFDGLKIADGDLAALKIEARGDRVFMPHYEPIRYAGDAKEYPLLLNTYKLMTNAEGRGYNCPWLQERLGRQVWVAWDSWVEINPQTAAGLGIKDGDEVWIESVIGRIKTRAVVYHGAMPHVVNMPFAQGHREYGRWAKGRGANPNWILVNETDHLGGLAAFFSTRVKVYKA